MKAILRFLGAITIASVSLTSVNACSTFLTKTPKLPSQDDSNIAVLLGWYSDNKITKIEQKLQYNTQTNIFEIVNNNKIITDTNFKERLLISNGDDFTAKNFEAVHLLRNLGFTSGGVGTIYSAKDVDDIRNLTAVITKVNHGNINAGTWDYQIDSGTMQVSVKLNNNILKTYNLDTLNNNNLNVPKIATHLVNEKTIALTKSCGFAVGSLTSNCILNLNSDDKQNEWIALLNFLPASPCLTWTDSMSSIEEFTTAEAYLAINFGKVIVVSTFNCGYPK